MTNFFKDFYAIVFQFVRKLDPKRGFDGAADYAKNMCALMGFFVIMFVFVFVTALLGVPLYHSLGGNRAVTDIEAIAALIVCYCIVRSVISRMPELQSPEQIVLRYESLSCWRKFFVIITVFSNPILILLIVIARQFFGAFGGL